MYNKSIFDMGHVRELRKLTAFVVLLNSTRITKTAQTKRHDIQSEKLRFIRAIWTQRQICVIPSVLVEIKIAFHSSRIKTKQKDLPLCLNFQTEPSEPIQEKQKNHDNQVCETAVPVFLFSKIIISWVLNM